MTFDFRGTRVLVTGGSNGVGLSVATAFSAAGADVTITGTRRSADDYGHDLSGLRYRQYLLEDATAAAQLLGDLESLDVLVNNAGYTRGRSEYDLDVYEAVLAANLTATFRLTMGCRHLLGASGAEGGGCVVNLGSFSSFFGLEANPAYGAAKAGVVQMTKTLAVAWAAEGIRVNAVAPGIVHSNMTAPMMGVPELTEPILARTPLRRFGSAGEAASVVLFLASAGASYVTGQTWMVDGGRSIQG